MKVNLTKKHIEDLEKAIKVLKADAKIKQGSEKRESNALAVTLSDIVARHETRQEKEY